MSLSVKDLEGASGALAIAPVQGVKTKRELRVLQVFSVLGVGGAETWLMSLLKYFHENNQELPVRLSVDILLTGGEKAVFDDEAIALGTRLFYVPFTRRNTLGFIREFRRILACGNYDAIHDHQDYIAGLHFLMGLGHLPAVRIAHVHNPLYHRTNYADGPIRRLAQSAGKRLLSKLATHVMGTSKQILDEYGFAGPGFRDVVTGAAHCGFEVTRFQGDRTVAHQELCRELGWDELAKVILFVGRLDGAAVRHGGEMMNHKNPEFALEVARACIAKDPAVRFAVAGDGAAKKRELEELVQQWGLAQEICFLGVRSDMPRLMLGSDLLLFPSVAEGLGMVAVEAQAAALPVLASDTTPSECVVIPELVKFLPLSTGAERWAAEALRLMESGTPEPWICNAGVRDSAFSIENSGTQLLQLYTSGRSRLTFEVGNSPA